jgi:hypothetical protein
MAHYLVAADLAREYYLQKALNVWRVHLVKLVGVEVLDERNGVELGDVSVEADLFFWFRPAWSTSSEHDVKDDAELSDVCCLTGGCSLGWILQTWGATNCLECVILLEARGKAEVCELDYFCFWNDDDLIDLQIAMNKLQTVDICHRT